MSELALATARRASYGEWSFRDTPERIRQIYFRPEDRSWRLIEPIRRMARFERHNLATDPVPWSDAAGRPGIDLILCRNVAIYFESAAAQRIYRRLAEAIRESGWLVLGPSDPMPQHPELLTPAYLPGAVLWRRAEPRPAEPRSARPPGTTRSAASAGGPEPVRRAGARPPTPAAAARAAGPSPAPPGVAASVPAAPTTDEAWRLAQAGEQAAARDCAQRLVEARPAEAGAHLLLGLLLLDEGEGARAAESLRRAAFLDATNPLAHFGLARALAGLGEGRRARSALARAGQLLAAQPDDQPVPAGGGMTAGELRRAVDAQLAAAADGSAR